MTPEQRELLRKQYVFSLDRAIMDWWLEEPIEHPDIDDPEQVLPGELYAEMAEAAARVLLDYKERG